MLIAHMREQKYRLVRIFQAWLFVLALFCEFGIAIPLNASNKSLIEKLQHQFSRITSLQADLRLQSSVGVLMGRGKLYATTPNNLYLKMFLEKKVGTTLMVLHHDKLSILSQGPNHLLDSLAECNFNQLKKEFPQFLGTDDLGSALNPANSFYLLRTLPARRITTSTLGEEKVFIFELYPNEENPVFSLSLSPREVPHLVKFWVGAKDGVTYKTVSYDVHGRTLEKVTLSNVVLNAVQDLKKFNFVPPHQVKAIDMTEQIEEVLKPLPSEGPP